MSENQVLREIECVAELKNWRSVLQAWFTVLDDYECENSHTDVAYWYNERATLSTLAGALWRTNNLVLEEYTTKRGGNGPNAGFGRTDMWCSVQREHYTIEAKQDVKLAYPASPKTLNNNVQKQRDWASSQCMTDNYGAASRLAMVFMVPSLLTRELDQTLFNDWLNAWMKIEANMKACYLKPNGIQSETNGRYFPGVMLFADIVRIPTEPDES